MFDKNDKFLFKAKIIYIVLLCTVAALLVADAIILFVNGDVVSGLTILIAGAVMMVMLFVMVALTLSVIVDIKLIRNKLYNYEQDDLNNFWGRSGRPSINPYENRVKKYEALTALNEALKSGAITQEEYEEQKAQILGE